MMLFFFFLVGIYVGNRSPYWLGDLISKFKRWRWLKEVAPTEVDEYKLCYGRHEWVDVKTVNIDGSFDKMTVCDKCGFIPTKNIMIPVKGLKRLKETQQILEFDEQVEKDFLTLEDNDIREHFSEELKNGLEFHKLIGLYNAGQNSKQRYILYKMARNEELKPKSGV